MSKVAEYRPNWYGHRDSQHVLVNALIKWFDACRVVSRVLSVSAFMLGNRTLFDSVRVQVALSGAKLGAIPYR